MRKYLKAGIAGLLLAAAISITGCGGSGSSQKESADFTPKLDTEKKIVLNTSGFFGNFEALDQVTNDFNKYYPNVEFN